jgi:hypothetical protein
LLLPAEKFVDVTRVSVLLERFVPDVLVDAPHFN